MQTILLLHGAIGAADQLQPVADLLKEEYDVHVLDFSGHGGREMPEEAFSMSLFASDLLDYMDRHALQQVSIFGYSMGGYVALYLAIRHPGRISRIVTLATKFHWDEPTAARESQMLNPEKIEVKLPAFADILKERHAPNDWKLVLAKTVDMMVAMGAHNPLQPEEYSAIQIPVLMLLGDRDKMVTLDETIDVYKRLSNAQTAMLPATPHPIEQVDVTLLAYFIKRFLS